MLQALALLLHVCVVCVMMSMTACHDLHKACKHIDGLYMCADYQECFAKW